MSDEDQKFVKSGGSTWKEERERISERNDAARKAGKQQREAYEQARAEARHAADARRRAELLKRTEAK